MQTLPPVFTLTYPQHRDTHTDRPTEKTHIHTHTHPSQTLRGTLTHMYTNIPIHTCVYRL